MFDDQQYYKLISICFVQKATYNMIRRQLTCQGLQTLSSQELWNSGMYVQ